MTTHERPRTRAAKVRKRALLSFAVVGALLVVSGCFPTPSQPPKVILYGDSLSVEAWSTFEAVIQQNGIADAVSRTVGGTAICDFFDEMEADKVDLLPTVVALEFRGNTQPSCVSNRGGATVDKYRDDAQHAIDIWKARGVQVYLMAPPAKVVGGGTPLDGDPFRGMYFGLAVQNGVGFIDAGKDSVLNPITGLYQFHMPCLSDETPELGCSNGIIQVRDPDGLHFCPSGSRPLPCNEYVSGARRFGFAMAAPIVQNHNF